MDALLISTYELGRQPLGLAVPLAHLRAAGLPARGLDIAVEMLDEDAVAAAGIVAFSTPMHTALRLAVDAAARVRSLNPRAKVVFYGLYAWLNAEYLLRWGADAVIGGECEEPLLRFALDVREGCDTSWARPVRAAGRPQYRVPDRTGLPGLDRYARLVDSTGTRPVAAVETSRGCAHQCLHCPLTPVYEGRLRIIPHDIVMADVAQAVALGAEHLSFADPDFFNGARHSMSVAQSIHEQFPTITFDATIKIEHLIEHASLLPELRRTGCIFVVSAVESLSAAVLEQLDKGHSASDVAAALELCRGNGISLRPSLLPFTPWSGLDDYLALLDFVEQRDLIEQVDAVQLAIRLLVPPGSSLMTNGSMAPFVVGLDPESFNYRWRHPDPRVDRLAKQVAGRVEAATCAGEDPKDTFVAIRNLARAAAGLAPLEDAVTSGGRGWPRLSESWFCCAEPTTRQRAMVTDRAVGLF